MLARAFLHRTSERHGKIAATFSTEAMRQLVEYSWPGNVRELQNIVERSVISSRTRVLDVDVLPPELRERIEIPQPGFESSIDMELSVVERMEKHAIIQALDRTGGHMQRAAALLGFGQATVYRKVKLYGIRARDFRVNGSAAKGEGDSSVADVGLNDQPS